MQRLEAENLPSKVDGAGTVFSKEVELLTLEECETVGGGSRGKKGGIDETIG